MKKDINPTKVEDIAMAIVLEESPEGEEVWNAYLLNLKQETLKIVLIRSNGYSEEKKTSELRHFFEEIPPISAIKIETILPDLLTMTNQYWVSFMLEKDLQDKKYVFVAGSIQKDNLVKVPLLESKGVVIE